MTKFMGGVGNSWCVGLVVSLCLGASAWSQDQFGPQANEPTGPKLATPTVFPLPGSFPTTESLTLLDAEPSAEVHYTLNGSMPTDKSPAAGPGALIFFSDVYDGDRGLKAGYTVRARAMKAGYAYNSRCSMAAVARNSDCGPIPHHDQACAV